MRIVRNFFLRLLGLQAVAAQIEILSHNLIVVAQANNAHEARIAALEAFATLDRLPGEKVH